MPTFEEELRSLGGGGQSFEDELAGLGGAQPPPQPPGVWDSLLDSVKETGSDALRGLNSGLYLDGSDEVAAAGRSASGAGDFDALLNEERGANADAEQRSPWAFNASKLLGYVPGMVVGPASAAGRVALSAGQGLASGALSSDSNDPWETAHDALSGGLWGMGGGMAGEGVSAGLSALGRGSENAGVGLRARGAGGTASELNTIRQNKGIDQMQTGLTDDFRALGLADSWKPQSAADVYRKLGPEQGQPGIMANAGQQTANAVDDATAAGARGDWGNVQQRMDDEAFASLAGATAPTDDMWSQATKLSGLGDQLPQTPGPADEWLNPATPRELLDQKQAYEASAYPPKGRVALETEAPKASAHRSAANAARSELGDVMEGTPQNADYLQGQDTYSRAVPIADMAGARAARNDAASSFTNPLTYGPAAAGAGLGGAAMGLPGAVAGAAAGGAANSLVRNYGQDVAGIGLQMAQRPLDAAAGAGQYAGQFSGPVGGSAQGDENQGSRGYMLPQAALELMRQPGALGKWEKEFFDAANSNDTHALSQLIVRLSHTDDEFAQTILPQLKQLTATGF